MRVFETRFANASVLQAFFFGTGKERQFTETIPSDQKNNLMSRFSTEESIFNFFLNPIFDFFSIFEK